MAEVAQRPADHPARDPGPLVLADAHPGVHGGLEGGQGGPPVAALDVGHAEVVEQGGVPVPGPRVAALAGPDQGALRGGHLFLERGDERGHVHRVDLERLQARVPGDLDGFGERRTRGLGLAARAQEAAALQQPACHDLRPCVLEGVEHGVTLVVALLEPEGPRHVGQEDLTGGGGGRGRRLAQALLGPDRVLEVPQVVGGVGAAHRPRLGAGGDTAASSRLSARRPGRVRAGCTPRPARSPG